MIFIDTNVLVHAVSLASPEHSRARAAVQALKPWDSAISRQVPREYMSVVTCPQQLAVPMSIETAMDDIRRFERAFILVEAGPAVWTEFQTLCRTLGFGGKQVHDAYLAVRMLAHGVSRLVTSNTKHFRRFAPLIEVVEP